MIGERCPLGISEWVLSAREIEGMRRRDVPLVKSGPELQATIKKPLRIDGVRWVSC
jgi:hypothetical protein